MSFVNAVLLNNPSAVAYNMMQLGVLQGDTDDPDVLKQSLINHLSNKGDQGVITLVQALDVPVNYAGPGADQLYSYHSTKANRAVVESEAPVRSDQLGRLGRPPPQLQRGAGSRQRGPSSGRSDC